MAKTPSGRHVKLAVHAPLSGADSAAKRPATAAYIFSAGGRLLNKTELDSKGAGSLEIPVGDAPTGLRVLVGPAFDGDTPGLDELLRRGAQERHLRVDDELAHRVDVAVDSAIWGGWLDSRCLVKGTLHKRGTRDGVSVDLPVCHATVEIYEVDPIHILVPRLPKDLLDRLRDVLLIPIPIPDPDPGPIRVGGRPGPDPVPMRARMALPSDAPVAELLAAPQSLRMAAAAGNDASFKQALIVNPDIMRALLCWLHPLAVTTQLIATTTTDDCGHFRAYIHKSIFNPDQPDLYFKARQRLFGFFDVTIYAPTPIACHTWWNYVCGTEVSLATTHPLAITCAPCPPVIAGNDWVLFTAIGNHPLSRIHGTGLSMPVSSTNVGLTDGGAPFGGLLRPRVEFDNSLRDSLGVKYYRLSWKRDAEPDTSYRPLQGAVNRHYAHMVGTDLVLDAYPLGPTTQGSEGYLFEIPPSIPPLGQWSIPDAVADTTSGLFDTVAADGAAIVDGLVQVRLELFSSAGVSVDIAAKGIRYFVPTSTDLSGTIHTVDASTLGLVSGNTMVITLHVNNERCDANIAPPLIDTRSADPCCGVLTYAPGQSVTLGWNATHPHGFATYNFGVVRGVNGVFSSSPANASVGPTGAFAAVRTVSQLLNDNLPPGCAVGGCPVAGFSENLYVTAMATDGWSRQSQYDASFVRAFVLAP